MVEDRDPEYDVDRAVRERQIVRGADNELGAAGAPVHRHAADGEPHEIFRDIHAPHVRAPVRELDRVGARPAAEIHDPQPPHVAEEMVASTRADRGCPPPAGRSAQDSGRSREGRNLG